MPTIKKGVLSNLINQIKPYVFETVLSLDNWRVKRGRYDGDGKYTVFDGESDFNTGDRWEGGYDDVIFFRCEAEIPVPRDGEKLYFNMNFGGETLIKFDGKIVGSVSSKEHHGWVSREDIPLPPSYCGRRTVIEAVGGICCGGFCDAAMAGAKTTHYDTVSACIKAVNEKAEDYFYRVRTLFDSVELIDDRAASEKLFAAVDASVHMLRFDFSREEFLNSIDGASELLEKRVSEIGSYNAGKVYMCGHSHIDVAWLWTVREAERKAVRTFANTLDFMDAYPDFKFAQSQAVLYDTVKRNAPEIFERIKEKVKNGQWEVIGNAWVEADTNIASGESLIRQLLYGREFFVREFGVDSTVYWLPDCFGFSWSLPQIIKKSGMKSFITAKLNSNDTNPFPNSMFRWRGISGDEVTAFYQRTHYQGEYDAAEVKACRERNLQKGICDVSFGMYGYGDGGSGVNAEMLERAASLRNIPGMPEVVNGSANEFFDETEKHRDEFPVWDGELYYENHRGTYTSQAFVKRNNRRGEFMLRNAEILSCAAEILQGAAYPADELESIWKILLINQFHDILPGSSIHEVYENTRRDYNEMNARGEKLISGFADFLFPVSDGKKFSVVNYLNFARTARVETDAPDGMNGVSTPDGREVASAVYKKDGKRIISFIAENIPSVGFASYIFTDKRYGGEKTVKAEKTLLENEYLKASFDENGELVSVYDKKNDREALCGNGNVLTVYQDKPIHESAWNIEYDYRMTPYPVTKAESAEVTENSAVRGEIKIVKRFNRSVITQYVSLDAGAKKIDFRTVVDWHETEKVLKASFPVTVRSMFSTCESAHGSVQRPTHRNTSIDLAKFEICMHKWVDLSESGYGVSVLNDCKYGCDVTDNVISITLMRAPVCPDPTGDIGINKFTYSLAPHADTWQDAGISQLAYSLNVPLTAVGGSCADTDAYSFVSVDRSGVVLDAFKKAQDGDGYIMRVFEAFSSRGSCKITLPKEIKSVCECLMTEQGSEAVRSDGRTFEFFIKPNEVKTFRIKF